MSDTVMRILTLLTMFLIGGSAFAQSDGSNDGYQVDSIFELKSVRDIDLDGATGSVLITLQDRVMKFDSFPLQVTADVPLKIEGITSVLHRNSDSAKEALVVMGDQTIESNGYSGGAILYFGDFSSSLDGSSESEEFKSGNAPFTQALLSDDGTIYGVNPRWFSILRTSVKSMEEYVSGESPVYLPSDLFLQCGSASQLSVFKYQTQKSKEPEDYYLTSVVGSKRIEYGPILVDDPHLPDTNCFDPYRSRSLSAQEDNSVGQRALVHELVDGDPPSDDRWQVAKYLLAFNTEGREVTVFPIRELKGRLTILRSESVSFDLADYLALERNPASLSGLMAADDAGEVVLVAYAGAERVHRFRQVEGELEYIGYFNVPNQVKNLQVSDDGSIAAISTGELGLDLTEELILIKNPGAVPEDVTNFGNKRFSVTNLQRKLSESGYNIKTDGIYGDETKGAIEKFLNPSEQPQEQRAIVVRSIRPSPTNTTANEVEIDDDTKKKAIELDRVIRGLVPLK